MSDERSHWKSLLNVLLEADAEPMDIFLAETVEGEWDFAFWQYDPDGVMVTYRCQPRHSIWKPIETPSYTGNYRKYERPEEQYSNGGPFDGDPDPK